MPNHWHFAVRPRADGDIGRFFGKFTQRVTQRWHAFHHTAGSGPLFQGRFKSFLVQTDSYFIQLMKYIEANPLRAKLVERAGNWKWGSLGLRLVGPDLAADILETWPVEHPGKYFDEINRPQPDALLLQIRNSVMRGKPLGDEGWVDEKVENYSLEYTIRNRGRQWNNKGSCPL
jgi:putative transposase